MCDRSFFRYELYDLSCLGDSEWHRILTYFSPMVPATLFLTDELASYKPAAAANPMGLADHLTDAERCYIIPRQR